MASTETSSAGKALTILSGAAVWDRWLNQLITYCGTEIYDTYVDPEGARQQPGARPAELSMEGFPMTPQAVADRAIVDARHVLDATAPQWVTGYHHLTTTGQRTYREAREFRQQSINNWKEIDKKLTSIRSYISDTCDSTRRDTLDPREATYEQVDRLQRSCAETPTVRRERVKRAYDAALLAIRKAKSPKEGVQAADQWQAAMQMAVKERLPSVQLQEDWITDLRLNAEHFDPTWSASYRIPNPELQYEDLASSLRSLMSELERKAVTRGAPVRAAYAVRLDGAPDQGTASDQAPYSQGAEEAPSGHLKRPAVREQGTESEVTRARKRSRSRLEGPVGQGAEQTLRGTCIACNRKGHVVDTCWYVIPERAHEGWKANQETQTLVTERLKKPRVKAAVEKARQQFDQAAQSYLARTQK
jgi:hypothetical protein